MNVGLLKTTSFMTANNNYFGFLWDVCGDDLKNPTIVGF